MTSGRLAAGALVLAAGAGLFTGCASRGVSAGGPPPATITVGGRTLYRHERDGDFDSALLDLRDPRRLLVQVPIQTASHPVAGCEPTQRPFARVVREDGRTVRIAVGGYRSKPQPTATPTGARRYVFCAYTITGYRSVAVELTRPLSTRTVYSAGSMSKPALVVTDASVPRPRWLPPGWRDAGLAVSFDHRAERLYRKGDDQLSVAVGKGQLPEQGGGSTAPIGAYRGSVSDYPSGRWVSWTGAHDTHYFVGVGPRGPNGHEVTLTLADVLRVARSVR